jgi:hypothetical protein
MVIEVWFSCIFCAFAINLLNLSLSDSFEYLLEMVLSSLFGVSVANEDIGLLLVVKV